MKSFKRGDLVQFIRTSSQSGARYGVKGEVLEVTSERSTRIFTAKFLKEYVIYGPDHPGYSIARTEGYHPQCNVDDVVLFELVKEYKLDQMLDEAEDLL